MYCNMFRVGEEKNRQPVRAGEESYIKFQWDFTYNMGRLISPRKRLSECSRGGDFNH